MPKIDCSNNLHNLGGDFSMYYRGTYVCRRMKDQLLVMYVREVQADEEGCQLENLTFSGDVLGTGGEEVGHQQWVASDVLFINPMIGFRKLGPKGSVVYISFKTPNRSNKKGLSLDNVLSSPAVPFSNQFIYELFANTPFEGKMGRDVYVSTKGNITWKRDNVGTFIEGDLKIKTEFSYLKELLCKLLARSSEVKSVEITNQ